MAEDDYRRLFRIGQLRAAIDYYERMVGILMKMAAEQERREQAGLWVLGGQRAR